MRPLLPEKESRNGTGAISLAQAKYHAMSIPLSDAFRYPLLFGQYGSSAQLVQSVYFAARTLAPMLSPRVMARP
jgi:hypothetical protein